MKKIITVLFICGLVLWIACSDDDDNGTSPNGDTTPRLVANTSVTEPTLSSPDESMWSSVTGATISLIRSGAVGKATGNITAVPASVSVKAILKEGNLYMRFEWIDDSLHLWNDAWILNNSTTMNFSRTEVFDEDEFFVMFTMPDSDWADTWNWRSLTTNPGNMAECFTYSEGALVVDAGANNFARDNTDYVDPSRPRWIHEDKALFQDPILYKQQAIEPEGGQDFGTGWEVGDMVAGWVIDSTIIDILNSDQESRWDVRSVFAYDGGTDKMKLVLTRALDSGFDEDLDMSDLDSVKCRIGVLDDQDEITVNNSSWQGFSNYFWLILP